MSKYDEALEDIYRNGVFISDCDALGKQHPTYISPETKKSIQEQCNILKEAVHKAEKYDNENVTYKNKFEAQLKYIADLNQENENWKKDFEEKTEVIDLLCDIIGDIGGCVFENEITDIEAYCCHNLTDKEKIILNRPYEDNIFCDYFGKSHKCVYDKLLSKCGCKE